MGSYNKGIVAAVGALFSILANFGVSVPDQIVTIVNAAVPLLAAVLVYAIPNKTA